MVQRVLNDDRKDPLDHVQMLFPPRGPEDEERIHGMVEEEEEVVGILVLGAHRDVQNGILKSDGNPRHILQQHLMINTRDGGTPILPKPASWWPYLSLWPW